MKKIISQYKYVVLLVFLMSCSNKNGLVITPQENCIIDVKYEIDSIVGLFAYKLVYELSISDKILFNSIINKEINSVYISNLYEDDFTFLRSPLYYFLQDSNNVYFIQNYDIDPCFSEPENEISEYIQHKKSILQLKIINSMDSVWILSTCGCVSN